MQNSKIELILNIFDFDFTCSLEDQVMARIVFKNNWLQAQSLQERVVGRASIYKDKQLQEQMVGRASGCRDK